MSLLDHPAHPVIGMASTRLLASFEGLDFVDDPMGGDDLPGFLETFEREALEMAS